MTIISRLASKQIEYLLESNPKSVFEKRIVKEVILSSFHYRGQFVLCTLANLKIILRKINEFQLFIVGITTDIEEDIPLITFNVEDFSSEYTSVDTDWIKNAITPLLIEKEMVWLRFYVDIPEEQVKILALKTGIPFN
jgi:hypothetical protein